MPSTQTAIDNFDRNLASVAELMRFDDLLIDILVPALESHKAKLVQYGKVPPRLYPDGLIGALRSIRQNASLKAYYQALYNQWLVLLVSYFASAVRELFVEAAAEAIETRRGTALLSEDVKVTVAELAEDQEEPSRFLAELLASQDGMSFQDMQSISRSFKKYFAFEPQRDEPVNNIVTAQACRHAIVHAGGKIDRRLLNQVRGASPRSVLTGLVLGEQASVSSQDVELVASSMREFLLRLRAATQSPPI